MRVILVVLSYVMLSFAGDFSYTDLKGTTHTQDSHKGKVLVVNYWATWCPTCKKEMPALAKFYKENSEKVEVIAVCNEDIDADDLKHFVKKKKLPFPVVLGKAESTSPFGALKGLPVTFIISEDGKILKENVGKITEKELKKYL